ncbi:MAG: gliding motility protein GldN [Sphingobacteriia bacterium]|jgi:gliding motility associated protien GldN
MKKMVLKTVFASIALIAAMSSSAQSKYKTTAPKQTTPAPATAQTPAAKQATTPAKKGASTSKYANAGAKAAADTTITNTAPVSGSSKYRPGNNTAPAPTSSSASSGTVNISYDTTIQGGFDVKPEISLRNNYAVDRSQVKDRKPLEYEDLREDDALFSHFVWREIDGREKINQSFVYPGKDDNGDQRFFSILLSAIKNDSVVAFSPDNDRFTIPLTVNQVMAMTGGAYDTVEVPDPVTGVTERIITKKPKFSPDSVYTFRIKEQVIFDKEASRLFTRIIGIAPIAKQVVAGKSLPRTLFWVYYPDMRKTLSKFEVYNPRNFASRMTWEELFESRIFSSYIIKSSMNNPNDKSLNAMIKDPLFRLLEGENIKQKIFNYEQDLWAY